MGSSTRCAMRWTRTCASPAPTAPSGRRTSTGNDASSDGAARESLRRVRKHRFVLTLLGSETTTDVPDPRDEVARACGGGRYRDHPAGAARGVCHHSCKDTGHDTVDDEDEHGAARKNLHER